MVSSEGWSSVVDESANSMLEDGLAQQVEWVHARSQLAAGDGEHDPSGARQVTRGRRTKDDPEFRNCLNVALHFQVATQLNPNFNNRDRSPPTGLCTTTQQSQDGELYSGKRIHADGQSELRYTANTSLEQRESAMRRARCGRACPPHRPASQHDTLSSHPY